MLALSPQPAPRLRPPPPGAQAGCSSTACAGEWVTLNVGGVVHTTTVDTLRRDSSSMLAAMFSGRYARAEGPVLIDRCGERFRHVLNFLRGGRLPPLDWPLLCALLEEAEFFGLESLREACEEGLDEAERRAESERDHQARAMADTLSRAVARAVGQPQGALEPPQEKHVFTVDEDF